MRGALILAGLLLSGTASAGTARIAVVMGNDLGDAEDERLRFAESDAVKVAEVLRDLGGFRADDTILLLGGDAGAARRALIGANDRIRALVGAGTEVMLLVYYSGHADARGLHMGHSAFEIDELEQLVRGSPARIRLLVLDSCRSGAVTRVKGGTRGPPLQIRLDERLAGEGVVFLTASAANENAQESDEIRGSFFTHHLVSALLGAGDADRDGEVSLEEAYRYSYENTLRSSSRTLDGLQHPTFHYQVRGRGEIVLSRLAASPRRGLLHIPAGRTYLLFAGDARGPVVAEVGAADRQRQVSVRAGRYFVRGRAADHLLEGTVLVREGERRAIDEASLTRVAYARLVRKGHDLARLAHGPLIGYRLHSPLTAGASPCHGLAAGWSFDTASFSIAPRLSACRGRFSNDVLRATEDEAALGVRVAHAWDLPWMTTELGFELGGALLRQRFERPWLPPAENLTAAGRMGLSVGASRDLVGGWYASVEIGAETYLFEAEPPITLPDEVTPETRFTGAVVGTLLVSVGTRLTLP